MNETARLGIGVQMGVTSGEQGRAAIDARFKAEVAAFLVRCEAEGASADEIQRHRDTFAREVSL